MISELLQNFFMLFGNEKAGRVEEKKGKEKGPAWKSVLPSFRFSLAVSDP